MVNFFKMSPVVALLLLTLYASGCDLDERSPRGQILVSISNDNPQWQRIYRMDDNGDLSRLGPWDDRYPGEASWSPDGKKIVFSAYQGSTAGYGLFVMNSDGSNPKPLKPGQGSAQSIFGNRPDWSPDGTKIAYRYCNCEVGGESRVFVIDLNTMEEKPLTTDTAWSSNPKWSSDGSKLLYDSDIDITRPGGDLYVMNSNGSNKTRLTFGARTVEASWGHLDSIIAYYSGSDTSIHFLNMTSMLNRKTRINLPNEYPGFGTAFSNDGNHLFFITNSVPYAQKRLYLLNILDGSLERLLADEYSIESVDVLQ